MEVIFQLNTAKKEDISEHFHKCSSLFTPTLSEKVNIEEYAKKIRLYAHTFEAWIENSLVGLNAIYLNQTEQKTGFITNISVDSQIMGLGIGKIMLQQSLEYAKNIGFEFINLETHISNHKAISFYLKNGFSIFLCNEEYILFQIKL